MKDATRGSWPRYQKQDNTTTTNPQKAPPPCASKFPFPHPRSQKRARREGFMLVYVPKVLSHEGRY